MSTGSQTDTRGDEASTGRVSAKPGQDGRELNADEQVALVREIRKQVVRKYTPQVRAEPSPIRVMARMVKEAEQLARQAGVLPGIIDSEILNRTIGDVNVRLIREHIDGVDYSTIGEDLGLILPGEEIAGRISDGHGHLDLLRREEALEKRLLRDYNWDMRIYDVYGVGNPLLREMLAARFNRAWGLPVSLDTTFISIGALDALFKSILTFGLYFAKKYGERPAFAFPAPGFAVVHWQVEAARVELVNYRTRAENRFKLTYDDMKQLLVEHPNLRMLYLTVSNNPTAFAYTAGELQEVYRAIEEDGREFAVLADLAYVGTGPEDEDRARMQGFNAPAILERTLFVNSLSKVFTLTGDRCGWVSVQNPAWADLMRVTWNNTTAGLPAQWQLRFTAYVELFDEHPEIQAKIRQLYLMRRDHFRRQLEELNREYDLFEEIGVDDHATIYNWSKLRQGEDALTLFEKTGIAGVAGPAFGYDDCYIRFSIGFIPME